MCCGLLLKNFVLLKGVYHEEFYCKKVKSFIAIVLGTVMCSTFISANAFAENAADNSVSITMNMDYSREVVLKNYERINATDNYESGVIKYDDGITPFDANPPKSYYNLDKDDYYYNGKVKGRIYTLKYFDTNGDGEIYLEGYAKAQNINNVTDMWQDVVIEVYDYSTGKRIASFDIDYRNELDRQSEYSLFYYNFCIYNLDPDKFYYFGFVNKVSPSGLDVKGYISHDWTLYFEDAYEDMG